MNNTGLVKQLQKKIRHILISQGYDITHSFNNPWCRRMKIIQNHHVSLVLDVGANVGLYANSLREYGYRGKIISFEPMSKEFDIIAAKASRDPLWDVYHLALGSSNGESTINISDNSYSSSILSMNDRHIQSAPDSIYIKQETITLATLDSVSENIFNNEDSIYMKVDVQGYEKEVLNGAKSAIKHIKLIEMELSAVTLYDGQPLYMEMINLFDQLGYDLVFIEPGFTDDQSGQMLQMDGIFCRR